MKYKIYYKIFALILVVSLASCVEVEDNYKDILESGETLYTTKPDSLYSYAGDHRVQLQPFVANAYSVTEFIVYWNDGADSQVFPFEKGADEVEGPKLIITGLEEKSYSFEVYSRDTEGNRSVRVDAFATSYGQGFSENLTPRSVVSYSFDGTNATINWLAADDSERGSEVAYTDLISGEDLVWPVAPEQMQTTLLNVDMSKPVTVRSQYVPTPFDEERGIETSIDTFPSEWVELSIPEELGTILSTITTSPVIQGIEINWTNPTNLTVDIKVDYTVGGEIKSQRFIRSEDTDGVFVVKGLENGAQDVVISVINTVGTGMGDTFAVEPISIFVFDNSQITPLILPFDAGEGCHGSSYARLLDGKTGEFWHSCDDSTDQYPFVMSFDMGVAINLAKFKLDKRSACCGDRSPAEMQFWGSNDLSLGDTADIDAGTLADWEADATAKGWVKIGGFEGNTNQSPSNELTGGSTTEYKFLRLVYVSAIDGGGTANFDELTFWTK